MEKLIKGVKPKNWSEFKIEASKHGMKVGEFLGYLVEEHKSIEKARNGWDHAFSKREKILTDADAEKMRKAIAEFEEEYDFE